MTDEVKKARDEAVEYIAYLYVEIAEMLHDLHKATGESTEAIQKEILEMSEHEIRKKLEGRKNEAIRN